MKKKVVRDINRSRKNSREVSSFHLNTLSIPSDETIGVLEGKVTYSAVIDAVTGENLGVPNMDTVRETMRPTNDPACRMDGEYYIANFRSPEAQTEYDHEQDAHAFAFLKEECHGTP